jgi:hypothetical protein
MNCISWGCVLGVLLSYVPVSSAREKTIAPDLSQVNDGKTWSVINAEPETARVDGKSVVQLKPKGGSIQGKSNTGLALVEGLEFAEGSFEVDLKGNGKMQTSFLGIAFNIEDEKAFEAVYFRPFNFMREGFRGHAVQYIAWPDNTWDKLRREKPGVYEAAVNPAPDPAEWFHARIEVTKKKVSVFVNDAKKPCLVVDRLTSREKGKVGLFVDSQEGAFGNLKIVRAE